jgi:threonylcarbamoyladenosine tRNA methylthiotransferase MtaB
LEKQGYQSSDAARTADLVILNTCTVTSSADDDVRKSIHRVHRENPEAQILVTGCYAQRAPEELSRIPGVTWVVGNSHKTGIPEFLAAPYHGQILVGDISEATGFCLRRSMMHSETAPAQPQIRGRNNPCMFCIFSSVRARSRSMALGVPERGAGYREVVLTGINLGVGAVGLGTRDAAVGSAPRIEGDGGRLRISSVELWTSPLNFWVGRLRRIAHNPCPRRIGFEAVKAAVPGATMDRGGAFCCRTAFRADDDRVSGRDSGVS